MKDTLFKIGSLILLLLLFAGFIFGEWFFVTRRCKANFGESAELKSIEAEKYLPFSEDSLIVRQEEFARKEGAAVNVPSAEIIRKQFAVSAREELPVLDGAAALLPVYAAFFHALYPEDAAVFDGQNYTEDSVMQYRNTLRGYKAIVDGTADVFFSAGPSEDQRAYAEERGVELEYIPIGKEAFVFIVNAANPVESLTVDEIRGIYAGRIRNFSEVGGIDRPINPVRRIQGSGSQTAMEAFMKGEEIRPSRLGLFGKSIGFSFRFYVEGIVGNAAVKMISVNDVYPSKENIQNGSYPLVSEFYAVKRKDDTNPNIQLLIDYILSPEGQRIIEESGYTGIGS